MFYIKRYVYNNQILDFIIYVIYRIARDKNCIQNIEFESKNVGI